MREKLRIAVLASGSGTNLQAIIDASQRGYFHGQVVVVVSDRKDAYALKRAERHNIDSVFINRNDYRTRDDFDRAIIKLLEDYRIDLVLLAGYMRVVGGEMVRKFYGRMMNIHPSLLPAFPGLEAQKQALDYGAKVTGCTVHFVDEGVDTGPIIVQRAVEVREEDTVETLKERILTEEHKIYPLAVRLYCEGKLKIEGRRVIIERDKVPLS
jgi:phosphoribosylglycinamide formyltransferase-1